MPKSVTVKIGSDTKDFIDGLKRVDKEISTTQKTAQYLEKSLQFEFDAARATQAQKQFQKALTQTEEKAQSIREKLKKLEESGRVDTADYSELELALAKTEAKAVSLRNGMKSLDETIQQATTDTEEQAKQLEETAEKTDKLEEETAKIVTTNEKLSSGFQSVGEKLENAGKKMAVFSAAAAGVLAGATAIGKKAATTGAELDDLSLRFGVSAETIQEWQYVAVQSGVDVEVFSKALVKMRAAMADIAMGTSNKATESLTALGITANNFASQEDMFDGIIAALATVKDETLQAAYANEIFGDKIATQMLPYINSGSDAIQKFKDEFAAMPALSNEQVAALAELDDTFYRLNTTMKYAGAQMGLALAPIMERVVVWIEEHLIPAIEKLAEWFKGLSPGMQDSILAMLGIIAVAAPLLMIIGKMSTGIGALIKLFGNLQKAQLLTATGFAALFGSAALAFDLFNNWKDMTWFEKLLKSLALAALTAAAAVTVFHASMTLGVAIGVITAGIAAGLAAINAAKKEILPDTPDFTADNIGNTPAINANDYKIPDGYGGGQYNSDNSYTSNDTYNFVINGTNLSAEEIAKAVSKEIATSRQARG